MDEGSMLVGGAIARSCAQHQQGRGLITRETALVSSETQLLQMLRSNSKYQSRKHMMILLINITEYVMMNIME
jgi:hypothetical protein